MAAEKKVTTVTLKDLAASLAETHGVAKSQMNGILAGMVEDLGKHLKKGSRIRISGLGILQVRKRPARMNASLCADAMARATGERLFTDRVSRLRKNLH